MSSSTSRMASSTLAFEYDARAEENSMSQATMTLANEKIAKPVPGPLAGSRAPRTLWSNAWRQFRRNKLAMAGLVYLIFLAFIAIFAPAIAPHNPVQSDLRTAGKYRQAAWIQTDEPRTTGDWSYPLGTDSNGRDVFSRLVYGTRISLVVGFIPMAVIMLIGIPIGLLAGFAGGRLDNGLMRFTDIVYAFPALLFFIIMQISFGDTYFGSLLNGLVLLFVTLSIINWTSVARLVRGDTMALKEKEFVEAARASGASAWGAISRPNLPKPRGPGNGAGAILFPGAINSVAVVS